LSATVYGTDAATTTRQTVTVGENGTAQIVYEMPADQTASPPATLTSGTTVMKLRSTTTETRGGRKTITASYSDREFEATLKPSASNPSISSSDATAQEIPIEQHPDYSAGASDANGVPTLIIGETEKEKPGVESYLQPGVIYRKSVYAATASFTHMLTNIGKRENPSGIPTGGGGWIKTGIQIDEQQDGSMITTTTWLWAPEGWDTDIYEAAT